MLQQGKLYEAAGEFEWAKKLLLRSSGSTIEAMALTLEKAGRTDDAIANYKTALEVYPDHIQSMEALARLQVKSGRPDAETPHLLSEVAMRGETEKWREWAGLEIAKLTRSNQTRLSRGFHRAHKRLSKRNVAADADSPDLARYAGMWRIRSRFLPVSIYSSTIDRSDLETCERVRGWVLALRSRRLKAPKCGSASLKNPWRQLLSAPTDNDYADKEIWSPEDRFDSIKTPLTKNGFLEV